MDLSGSDGKPGGDATEAGLLVGAHSANADLSCAASCLLVSMTWASDLVREAMLVALASIVSDLATAALASALKGPLIFSAISSLILSSISSSFATAAFALLWQESFLQCSIIDPIKFDGASLSSGADLLKFTQEYIAGFSTLQTLTQHSF